MFREIVLFLHRTGREICLIRPAMVARGSGCRPAVRNSKWANLIFFIAIFTPLYVCLLKDVFGLLRYANKKSSRGEEEQ